MAVGSTLVHGCHWAKYHVECKPIPVYYCIEETHKNSDLPNIYFNIIALIISFS